MQAQSLLAVVLVAGAGRRMWPFAVVRPKALLPVCGQPNLKRLVGQLRECGVEDIVIAHDRHSRTALACVADERITTFAVDGLGGAAPALAAIWRQFPQRPLLVIPGDCVLALCDLKDLISGFSSGAAGATLVAALGGEDPRRWVCAEVQGGELRAIVGHPREGQYRWTGLCVLSPEACRYLERAPALLPEVPVGGMPAAEADLACAVSLMLSCGLSIHALVVQGFAVDMDKPWHILQANMAAAQERFASADGDEIASSGFISPAADIDGQLILDDGAFLGARVRVRGRAWLQRGAVVDNGAILEGDIVVGEGARVRHYAHLADAVIGPKCIVDHAAECTGVVFEGAYLYHYCHVAGVVGTRVDIGAATVCGTLRFDDGDKVHNIGGGREVPPLGSNLAYIGDYARTGVNAILMPGVKVGCYSCVGPGVVLYEDLPDRQLVLVKQELEHRPWGPERYGW